VLSPLLVPLQKSVNFVWFFLRPSVRYARFLKSKSIDIVHLNNSINTNHDWMLAARMARVRLVSHERGISENLSRSSRLLGGSADALVCISSKIRETLLRHGLSAEKAVVVHNGIDTQRVRPAQEPERLKSLLGIGTGDPVIGVVGNIKQWKGQETAVRATAILKRTWPGIRLLLVGGASEDDPYLAHLNKIIRELSVERNVIFTGFQENPADYINAMDVVVHASIEPEPFGRVNIEAMFLNKPVVSTNIGGPTEIFEDDRNGFLIDPGRPDLLAEKLSLLLSDPELRRRIGMRAHETVMERFTITRTVREIEGIYARLVRQ
jgi:glycosyltransferase involved in cell wall biosynthesis